MSSFQISRRGALGSLAAAGTAAFAGCATSTAKEASAGAVGARSSQKLQAVLDRAVAAGDVPFVVAAVTDSRSTVWEGASGNATSTMKASQDIVFPLFSASKAIGAVATMVMIDRGKLTMDTKVVDVLPEFADVKVLAEMGSSGPVYQDPRTPVTLRQVLTHTYGQAYNNWSPKEKAWEDFTKKSPADMQRPMMFQPGTEWLYGPGPAWAGWMVQKVDGRNIGQFVYEEVFQPLQMNDTMFELDRVQNRLPQTRARQADGNFADTPNRRFPPRAARYVLDGCLNGSAQDYVKLLRLVLNKGQVNGRTMVSAETMRLMTENQIGSMRLTYPPVIPQNRALTYTLDPFPGLNIPCSHTAGFVRNEIDVPGRRRAGSLTWAGFFNTHYWVDPTTGIGAALFCHHHPFNDPRYMKFYDEFEKAVYSELT